MPSIHDRQSARPLPTRCPSPRLPPSRRLLAAPAVVRTVVVPESPRAPVTALAGLAVAFAACLAYAIVRYVVLKGEPLASVPLYVTNKALAVFSVVALAAYAARPRAAWRGLARGAGLTAGGLHAVASVALLRPAYLGKLFAPGADGRFTAAAEGALLCGAIALVALLALRIARPQPGPRRDGEPPHARSWPRRAATLGGLVALVAVIVHSLLLGGLRAFDAARWPGGMPPMTLLGAVVGLIALAAALRPRRAGR